MRARSRTARWIAAFGAGLLAGCVSSALWSVGAAREYRSWEGLSASRMTFLISSDPTISDGLYSYHADAFEAERRVGSVRLILERDVPQGSSIRVIGRVSKFDDDEWGRARFFKHEMRRVKAVKLLRIDGGRTFPLLAFRNRLIRFLSTADPSAGPLVAGVVCGRSSELNAGDASDWFSRTGTSHLIAVSGSHLALVCFLAEDLASRVGVSRRVRLAVMVLVGVCYTMFTGASASAVRSCCMVASGLVVNLSGRRRHGISALACTMLVLCLLNPSIVFDLGFQLSCASVLGILLFAPYLGYVLSSLHAPEFIASPLALTFCSQLATIPLTVPVFGSVSLIAPVANLIIGPVVSVLLLFGIVIAPIAVLVPIAAPLVHVPIAAARCALFFEQLFSSIPYASMPLSLDGPALFLPWLASGVIYVLWPVPRPRAVSAIILGAALFVVIPFVYWDRFAAPSVTVLDVGQADAILVRQGPATLLVDAGVDERVLDALARQNVHHLDAVLITHWDEDHWGGLPSVLDEIPVERLFVARGAGASEPDEVARAGVEVTELSHGDGISVGDFHARVVWPWGEVAGLENSESLCLKLEYRKDSRSLSMLLTGDSEVDQEHSYSSEVGDIDVLKVGHHGSKVSVDAELLEEIRPEVCIASAGEGNRYGHPSKACRDAVEQYGSIYICTIDHGDVRVSPGESGPSLSVQKGTLGST